MFTAKAPTRLDFGGGWTDVPPFPEERGGFVCSVAITRYATAALTPGSRVRGSDSLLCDAALRRAGLDDVQLEVTSDFPVGSGLGGSSAAGVAAAAVLAAHRNDSMSPAALAEWSRAVEAEEMGIAGGRQDHYAAAFGGALGIRFEGETTVERIALGGDAAASLERRCILAYTGESRISADTITAVLDGYLARDGKIVSALERMKSLALSMRDALRDGDIDTLASLVDEHWRHQRSLHPRISTPRIDALEHAARAAGARGMKALGASGGGCVIVFANDADVEGVQRAIAPYASVMDWGVSHEGVTLRTQPE